MVFGVGFCAASVRKSGAAAAEQIYWGLPRTQPVGGQGVEVRASQPARRLQRETPPTAPCVAAMPSLSVTRLCPSPACPLPADASAGTRPELPRGGPGPRSRAGAAGRVAEPAGRGMSQAIRGQRGTLKRDHPGPRGRSAPGVVGDGRPVVEPDAGYWPACPAGPSGDRFPESGAGKCNLVHPDRDAGGDVCEW